MNARRRNPLLVTRAAIAAAAFCFLAFANGARAQGGDFDLFSIRVAKTATFFQYGPTFGDFLPQPILYEGQARVQAWEPGSILSAMFAPPGWGFFSLQADSVGDFYFQQAFASQDEWHFAFPPGSYRFEMDTASAPQRYTASVEMPDRFANLPRILNGWFSGVVQLNANSPFTFQWNNFENFDRSLATGSAIRFEVMDFFDRIVFSQEFFEPVTSVTVDAGKMSPGQFYFGRVYFAHGAYSQDDFSFYEGFSSVATAFLISAVDGPPVILPPLEVTVSVGQLFIYVITATNAPGFFGTSNLPPGVVADDLFGLIGGFPTQPGRYQIPINATNALGTGSHVLTLNVMPAADLAITSSTRAAGAKGKPFSFQVVAQGATSAARLSASGLPPGLSANPISGEITGTPTQSGTFQVALTVTDQNARATGVLDLSFSEDPAFPAIRSSDTITIAPGQSVNYKIDAPVDDSKASSDATKFTIVGNLPPGLSFDSKTGTISGTYGGSPARGGEPGEEERVSGGIVVGTVQLFANNSRGTATIPLLFLTPPVGAVNISTRMAIGTDENVMIGGFIVTGNAPKKLILRGIGPSLRAGDGPLPGSLQDPVLELYNARGELLTSNDDWKSHHQQEIVDTTVPPADDRESAIVAAFEPGNYTAVVRGKTGGTGIGLVEIYDLGTASLNTGSNAKLAQISTRGRVQAGDNVMIGGFIIAGASSKVIVRAIGPSLGSAGVAGALQDTTLELRDGHGALIAGNDDWRTHQEQEIIATTVPPTDNRESAVVQTLNPGAFTAVVRGKDGTAGVAIVEVYVLQ